MGEKNGIINFELYTKIDVKHKTTNTHFSCHNLYKFFSLSQFFHYWQCVYFTCLIIQFVISVNAMGENVCSVVAYSLGEPVSHS